MDSTPNARGLCTITDHAGRFPSGWGWFCSFQLPLGVYTQQNIENWHINYLETHGLLLETRNCGADLDVKRRIFADVRAACCWSFLGINEALLEQRTEATLNSL
jgi:hypothetical protein